MGQLGQGLVNPSDLAANVVGLESGVAAVSAGGNLTCAVLVGGGVKCWGANTNGELGNGSPPVFGDQGLVSGVERSPVPVDVVGLASDVVAVTTGAAHACALTRAGGVKCWGANTNGELGNGSRPVYDARGEAVSGVVSSAEPVDVTGLASGVLSVDAGGQHTCAVLVGGSVRCWGRNFDGQLGDGAAPELDEQDVPVSGETASGIPVEVVGLGAAAVSVTAGDVHTCAVLAGGAVRCWGGNFAGQLGDGVDLESESSVPNRGRRDRPGDVVGLASGVVAVSAGDARTCALTDAGAILCWGRNEGGALARPINQPTASSVPLAVSVPKRFEPVARSKVLNLIVVDSDLDVTSGFSPEEIQSEAVVAARLRARDPALLKTIALGVRTATAGRLEVRVEVTFASVKLVEPSGCTNVDGGQQGPALAAERAKDGAINVAIVKTVFCRNSDGLVPEGYDSPDTMPVVGWASLVSVRRLVRNIVHEYGHDAGLVHAGSATCKDEVGVSSCEVYPVGDPASVMSYTGDSDVFTATELLQLSLLPEAEVAVDPGTGTHDYRLVDVALEGVKVVSMVRGSGAAQGVSLWVTRTAGRVEVRYPGAGAIDSGRDQASLVVVNRLAPAPGEVVYRGGGLTVTLVKFDDGGNAIVRVAHQG